MYCILCGDYVVEGSQVCYNCKKKYGEEEIKEIRPDYDGCFYYINDKEENGNQDE